MTRGPRIPEAILDPRLSPERTARTVRPADRATHRPIPDCAALGLARRTGPTNVSRRRQAGVNRTFPDRCLPGRPLSRECRREMRMNTDMEGHKSVRLAKLQETSALGERRKHARVTAIVRKGGASPFSRCWRSSGSRTAPGPAATAAARRARRKGAEPRFACRPADSPPGSVRGRTSR